MQMTEQFILTQAPNGSAAENGRKLSAKGSFSARMKDSDGKVFWAECAGSGKKPYRVSIDFSLSDSMPTCRCSCPSRQFPCKHALGLMFEMFSGKDFSVGDIPEDLAAKQAKQAARAAKKEETPAEEKKTKKASVSAQKKKVMRQLEGIELAENMVRELLSRGLATLSGTGAETFEKLAKDLGNYYLSGPQLSFMRIALAVKQIRKEPDKAEDQYKEALRVLIALNAVLRRSRQLLEKKIEENNFESEDSVLFEALGGVWRLEDLKAIGSFRENVSLIQLSFDVFYDEARREFINRGFWIDMSSGKIVQTLNYRPLKALKYVKAEDSCFEVVDTPILYEYPGDTAPRVRWEEYSMRPVTEDEVVRIAGLSAKSIADTIKMVKNEIKNAMSPKYVPCLIGVEKLGRINGSLLIEDSAGQRMVLRDRKDKGEGHLTAERIKNLPKADMDIKAVFGLVFYDETDRTICMQPFSIVTSGEIIRLLY